MVKSHLCLVHFLVSMVLNFQFSGWTDITLQRLPCDHWKPIFHSFLEFCTLFYVGLYDCLMLGSDFAFGLLLVHKQHFLFLFSNHKFSINIRQITFHFRQFYNLSLTFFNFLGKLRTLKVDTLRDSVADFMAVWGHMFNIHAMRMLSLLLLCEAHGSASLIAKDNPAASIGTYCNICLVASTISRQISLNWSSKTLSQYGFILGQFICVFGCNVHNRKLICLKNLGTVGISYVFT